MGKQYYIKGGVVAEKGCLYTRDIKAGCTWHPEDAEEKPVENGEWRITKNEGSIFDTYYVSGYVTAGGTYNNGAIRAYIDIYNFTIEQYEKGITLIRKMLLSVPEGEYESLYCQQQFASVFSLMEQFLSCTFVRQTCDREDSYHRVLKAGHLQEWYGKKQILNGPDGLDKELMYIEQANRVVYNNIERVPKLFKAAFDVSIDMSALKDAVTVRNDIVHRFGHTIMGEEVRLTAADVRSLIKKVDELVHKTAEQILALPERDN